MECILGEVEASRKPTKIGDGVYIGPNPIIQMGVSTGDGVIIGAMSLVNRDVPAGLNSTVLQFGNRGNQLCGPTYFTVIHY